MQDCGRGQTAGKQQLFVNALNDKDDCLGRTSVCLSDSTDKSIDNRVVRKKVGVLPMLPQNQFLSNRGQEEG